MPNLFNASTFKLTDRRDILERVYSRLFDSPDCYIPIRGGLPDIGEDCDASANWHAREDVSKLMQSFPRETETINTDPAVIPDDVAETVEGEYNGN